MAAILQELKGKIKSFLGDPQAYTATVLILVAMTAFGLGRQSVREVESGRSTDSTTPTQVSTATASTTLPSTYYVASRNGKSYHLPHCSGAKNISEANKVTFKTKEEAETAGYRPAANCKGI